jgi:hypothetical protein
MIIQPACTCAQLVAHPAVQSFLAEGRRQHLAWEEKLGERTVVSVNDTASASLPADPAPAVIADEGKRNGKGSMLPVSNIDRPTTFLTPVRRNRLGCGAT